MSVNDELSDLLQTGLRWLKLGRLDHEKLTEKSVLQRTVLTFYWIPLAGSVFMSWHNLLAYPNDDADSLADNLIAVGGFTQAAVKLLTCIIFKDELKELLDCSESWDLSAVSDPDFKESIRRKHSSLSKVIKAFSVVTATAVLAVALSPILLGKGLPAGVYNYGGSKELHRLCCVTQQICLLCVYLYLPALDIIYIGGCTTLGTQFKIAGDFLKENISTADLNKFVDYHNHLYRCAAILGQVYSLILLTQYLTGILILCAEMYTMAEGNGLTAYAFTVFLYVFSQCGMYCVFAEHLSSEAAAVADIVYAGNWEDELPSELILILGRSQRTVILSAFGLINVNIATFTKILKLSWSSFMLLRAMKSN